MNVGKNLAPINNFRVASAGNIGTAELDEKLEALNEDLVTMLSKANGVSEFRKNLEFQAHLGRLLRESVDQTFSMQDPTPIFTERRDAKLEDKIEFTRLVNTFRVVQYAPHSHPLIFTPRKAKYTIKTSKYELPYGISLMKIKTGQYTVAQMVTMAAQAMVRHKFELVMGAIEAALPVGSQDLRGRSMRTQVVGSGDVTAPVLDAALRRLDSVGGQITIFGSRYALWPIMALTGAASENLNEELMRRGTLGFYKGARLVEIKDEYNEFTQSFTKINGVDLDNLIFISAGEPGAVYMERDLSGFDWEDFDPEKAYFRTGTRFDHGVTVWKPWRYHIIELNAS